MKLSVSQREAIRHFASSADPEGISKRTISSLFKRGLIAPDPWGLTPAGLREHRRIMSSGDGPEDLKELFRF